MDIAHTIHPHPTLSEAIGEAALAVDGKEFMLNKKILEYWKTLLINNQ